VILKIKDAANGFIVEIDPEIMYDERRRETYDVYLTRHAEQHIFTTLDELLEFVRKFYTERPNKNTPPRRGEQ
jgi:hypothetical protein